MNNVTKYIASNASKINLVNKGRLHSCTLAKSEVKVLHDNDLMMKLHASIKQNKEEKRV